MTPWSIATGALLVLLAIAASTTLRGSVRHRLVGMQVSQVLVVLVAVTAALAADREVYLDVALVAAVVVFASTLVHARVAERWW